MNICDDVRNGTLSLEELERLPALIARAKFVREASEACKRTLSFSLGEDRIQCYQYMDRCGEYESWGMITPDGTLSIRTSWGGMQEICNVNVLDPKALFLALEDEKGSRDLERFLREQIEKANQ